MTLQEAKDKLGCDVPCERGVPVNLDVVNILCDLIDTVRWQAGQIEELVEALDDARINRKRHFNL